MNMNFDLSLHQTQKLVMTQQLQMAIKVLQLSAMELNEYVQNDLVDNPVLELNPPAKDTEEVKIDWKEVAKSYNNYDYDNRYYDDINQDDEENVSPLNFVASVTTLRDYLLFQLHLAVREKESSKIGEYIIDNIDNAGYLRMDISDIAEHFKVDNETVIGILNTIQTFDPPGVGSTSIEECLIIQLCEQGALTNLLETVVRKYLNEIGQNKYNTIAKALNITSKKAQEIGDVIKALEPKPGRGFPDNNAIKYVVPDIFVEKVSGHYVVLVNDRTTPRLTINSYYRGILENGDKDDETREYIKKKLDSALWLIRSIEQRRTTIYNVVTSIVSFQCDFLEKGVDYLKPLTLKEVAEDIHVHESTVSRAINGKYVQTPRGLFQLKYFFKRGLDGIHGDNKSSESIRKLIREIICAEDAKKPLSDQKITDILKKDGINISRRTVTKYREEMEILAASKRKRF